MSHHLTDSLRIELGELWGTCELREWAVAPAQEWARRILQHQGRYVACGAPIAVPWQFIAVVHMMEADLNFNCHLYNGDSLDKRTVHAPKGRPRTGTPPFTWEYSARESLKDQDLDKWADWSVVGTLYQLERYNGFGYRNRNIKTPYLWCGTTHYSRGKYRADGKFDPNYRSKDVGCAPVLKALGVEMP